MIALLNYLDRNRESLGLDHFGVGRRLHSVIKTPRFRASRHVIVMLYNERDGQPCLVAKIARLPEDTDGIEREATNLRDVQQWIGTGSESVPRLIVHDQLDGFPFLIETALAGEPISPKRVAKEPSKWCQAVLRWLHLLDGSSAVATTNWNDESWQHTVVAPLHRCRQRLPWGNDETHVCQSLDRLMMTLEKAPLRHVFEHGDLSHPNLIEYRRGEVGVIDWELAERVGVPLHDLVFFLMYVALSSAKSNTASAQQTALAQAFRTQDGWAWNWIHQYLNQRALPRELAQPLAMLALMRYLDTTLSRLITESEEAEDLSLSSDLSAWFLQNRYFQFARQFHTCLAS